LARDECRRLLSSTNIGRLAFCTDAGPRIMPMNYTLVSEAVVLRTSIDSETSHQLFDHPIAFEVDQVDDSFRRDGALLVVGKAQPIREESLLLLDVGQAPQPWPEADERWSCNCHRR
jgi:nitroimidazol reductase NimA-like FMN-containing flavoprotein (pyridoxamine 5'-phosphate oxidase superfamily)